MKREGAKRRLTQSYSILQRCGICMHRRVSACVIPLTNEHSARFIQAVSELQLLGFIKPTQRKTDHVQRLTWGLC